MFKNTSSTSLTGKDSSIEKLEVTVIPVDEEPYSKVISFSNNMMSKYKCHFYRFLRSVAAIRNLCACSFGMIHAEYDRRARMATEIILQLNIHH